MVLGKNSSLHSGLTTGQVTRDHLSSSLTLFPSGEVGEISTELALESLLGRTAILIPAPGGQSSVDSFFYSYCLGQELADAQQWLLNQSLIQKERMRPKSPEFSLTFVRVLPQVGARIVSDLVVRYSLNSNLCLLSPPFHSLEFLVFQMSIIFQFIFQKTLELIPQRSYILA